jgi:hypothetical protein
MAVREVELRGQTVWPQRHGLPARVLPGACRIGTGKPVKKIVGRSILLNDDDDVLDFA